MPELLPLIITAVVASAITGAIGLGYSRVFRGRDQRTAARVAEISSEKNRVSELVRQVAVLESAAIPVNAFIQALAIANLKHFHTPELDELLTRVGPPSTLTLEETERMRVLLQETIDTKDPLISETEKRWAKILPDVMELRIIEEGQAVEGQAMETETVAVAVPITAEEREETSHGMDS